LYFAYAGTVAYGTLRLVIGPKLRLHFDDLFRILDRPRGIAAKFRAGLGMSAVFIYKLDPKGRRYTYLAVDLVVGVIMQW